jgi:hypothetical protein
LFDGKSRRSAADAPPRHGACPERASDSRESKGVRHPDDEALCSTESGRRVLALIDEAVRAGRLPDPSMNLSSILASTRSRRIELIATVEEAFGVRLRPMR